LEGYIVDVVRHLSKQWWDVRLAGDLTGKEAYNILLALYPSKFADHSLGYLSNYVGRTYDISADLPFCCNTQIKRFFQGDSNA
jgi:hypothetical protein